MNRCSAKRKQTIKLAATAAAAATTVALMVGVAGALASGSDIAVKALSAQRAANGIPSLTENGQATAGCQAHNKYMHINNYFGHGEDPSKPGYSTLGDIYQQPFGEVLAEGETGFQNWLDTGYGPWESAPIHLFLILDPSVDSIGADETYGFDCMRPDFGGSIDGFYSYPGPDRTDVAISEQANEWPYVPQQKVGIPASQTTGINILLWGPCQLQDASLSGPERTVSSQLATSAQVSFFGDGGDLIPVKPLDAFTRYQVHADWSCGVQDFGFTTGGKANSVDDVQAVPTDADPSKVQIQVSSSAPDGTVTVTGPAGTMTLPLKRADGQLVTAPVKLTPGHYKACATTGSKASGYEQASSCSEWNQEGQTSGLVMVGQLVRHGSRVTITVSAHGPALGRVLAVHGQNAYRCGAAWCGGWTKPYNSKLALSARHTFSFPAPKRGTWLNVYFELPDFIAGGIRYEGSEIDRDLKGR